MKIEIYTTNVCPFCVQAKRLLTEKGLEFEEIHVDQDPAKMQEMLERSQGRRSVPEIFINDQLIGGYDELHAANQSGELDKLISEG